MVCEKDGEMTLYEFILYYTALLVVVFALVAYTVNEKKK